MQCGRGGIRCGAVLSAGDVYRSAARLHGQASVSLDDLRIRAAFDRQLAIARLYRNALIVPHRVHLVVANGGVHIVLTVDGDLFLAAGVIHRHLVVTTALISIGLEPAHDFLTRQLVRRHIVWIINVTNDHWLIWVALDECDDYFLSNPGNLYGTPL